MTSFLAEDLTPDPWDRVKGQNLKKNQNMVMWHIKLRKSDMQHHDSIKSPQTLGVGLKGQNLTFSNHGHVVYQIK